MLNLSWYADDAIDFAALFIYLYLFLREYDFISYVEKNEISVGQPTEAS